MKTLNLSESDDKEDTVTAYYKRHPTQDRFIQCDKEEAGVEVISDFSWTCCTKGADRDRKSLAIRKALGLSDTLSKDDFCY